MKTLVPFSLKFNGLFDRFPFVFEGNPVATVGNNPAPSCFISNRKAGDMIFRLPNKNRERLFDSIGIPKEKVYSLRQTHSRDVFPVGEPESDDPVLPPAAFAREGDGIVSFSPEVFLAVTVADCLPVFLLDTERGYFSVLHSGWKGTGIVLKALEIMKNAGTRPEAVAAVLGPCIQSCCYKVDEDRAKIFEAEFGSTSPFVRGSAEYPLGQVFLQNNGGYYLNLQAANARLLGAAGVRHISYCTDCTFTDTRLGSFRREESSYTRMIAIAG